MYIKMSQAWRSLKGTVLSEGSPPEMSTYCIVPTVWQSGKGKAMQSKTISDCEGGRAGLWGLVGRAEQVNAEAV